MSARNPERNRDIATFLQMGFSIAELADSYDLTEASIYTIRRESGIASDTDRTLVPYKVIAKELGMTKYEVEMICSKFLSLAKDHFEDKGIEYDDLTWE